MTTLALELNDCDLLSQTDDGDLNRSPAFALLNSTPFVFGEAARAERWQHPQYATTQFWQQLGTEPLPHEHDHARHTADIAFAHLKALWEQHDCPDEWIIALPGSFSDQQISLLLGLINALPAKAPIRVSAIIDSAIAGSLNQATESDNLHIDIQLHQTVITRIAAKDGQLTKVHAELIPDLGLLHLHNTVAKHVSRWLSQQHRFDPFHSAASQQMLFNHIPEWLALLQHQSELETTIPTHNGNGSLPVVLRWQEIEQQLKQRIASLTALLGSSRYKRCKPCFSYRSQLLHALINTDSSILLTEDAAIQTLFEQAGNTPSAVDQPLHLESLAIPERSQTDSHASPTASHLLFKNRAYSLAQAISINVDDHQGLQLTAGIVKSAQLVLATRQGVLEIIHNPDNLPVELPENLTPGAQLSLHDQSLLLIEVTDA